jgi:hypothetical protein
MVYVPITPQDVYQQYARAVAQVPLQHPLAQLFQRAAESLTTSLGNSSIDAYQSAVHLFLTYMTALITHRSIR